jgi:hypothetical protein
VRRQSHPRQRLIGAAPEFLDGTKRRTILQTGTVQGLVIKLGRNLVATAELDLLEGRDRSIPLLPRLVPRHAGHVRSPFFGRARFGTGQSKLSRCIIDRRENGLHDAFAGLRQDQRLAILQVGEHHIVGREVLARRIAQGHEAGRQRQDRHAVDAVVAEVFEAGQTIGALELSLRQSRPQPPASHGHGGGR